MLRWSLATTKGSMMTATEKRPKTKAAKDVKAGDWVTFGNMSYSVHRVEVDEETDTTFLAIGYSGTELKSNRRVKMHYPS
jgi:plastocyanin